MGAMDSASAASPELPDPDDKDWTWVLDRPCPDCGFDAATVRPADYATAIRQATLPWQVVLRRPEASVRPEPKVWSPLEYGCHVRDVCRLFDERTRLMLTEDGPDFADWDQDATAVAQRYFAQDPQLVRSDLAEAAQTLAETYAAIPDDAWERTGRRSNGSLFTIRTLGGYLLHDLSHHVWDVRF